MREPLTPQELEELISGKNEKTNIWGSHKLSPEQQKGVWRTATRLGEIEKLASSGAVKWENTPEQANYIDELIKTAYWKYEQLTENKKRRLSLKAVKWGHIERDGEYFQLNLGRDNPYRTGESHTLRNEIDSMQQQLGALVKTLMYKKASIAEHLKAKTGEERYAVELRALKERFAAYSTGKGNAYDPNRAVGLYANHALKTIAGMILDLIGLQESEAMSTGSTVYAIRTKYDDKRKQLEGLALVADSIGKKQEMLFMLDEKRPVAGLVEKARLYFEESRLKDSILAETMEFHRKAGNLKLYYKPQERKGFFDAAKEKFYGGILGLNEFFSRGKLVIKEPKKFVESAAFAYAKN